MKIKKIAILGTRGIPARYGGFETFAQELSKRLQSESCNVIVFCDQTSNPVFEYEGVELRYSKYIKSEHPLLFYFDCIWQATRVSDVLLITGTGGAFFYWLPKLLGKKIITNIDGMESRRAKWNFLKKIFIKITEHLAIQFSDKVIADSLGIKKYVLQNYRVDDSRIAVIEYGAEENTGKENRIVLESYGLIPNEYYLVVARLEPENNIKEILDGFLSSGSVRPLIVIGSLNNNSYVSQIRNVANGTKGRIKLLGAIYDKSDLDALRFFSYAYIHGHSVGGTNPSLLEALAASNLSVCHDNEFNREVTENQMFYFKTSDDLSDLIGQIEMMLTNDLDTKKFYGPQRILSHYTWEMIAEKYQRLINELA